MLFSHEKVYGATTWGGGGGGGGGIRAVPVS
jgi:hypothetical protein